MPSWGLDQISVMVFDANNNGIRIEASPGAPGTHTPSDADQVFNSIFDDTNNALHVVCVSGCGTGTGGAVFQVNGSNTASQTTINLANGPNITFTNTSLGNIQASLTGVIPATSLPTPTSSSLGGIQAASAVAHMWINSISGAGAATMAQPAFSDLSGTVADTQLAGAYSGVGACAANSFAVNLSRNAAPLCQAAVAASTAPANQFATGISAAGTLTYAQPSFSNLAGAAGLTQLPTTLAQFSGTITVGDCAKWSANGVLADAGGACGSGSSGGLPGGGANAVQYYATASTFGGDATHFSYNPTTYALNVVGALTAGSIAVTGNTAGCSQFNAAGSANYVQLCAPTSLATNTTWALPTADGTNGQVLQTNGAGALSWLTPFSNPMTGLGALIYGGASGAATQLAGNTTATPEVLSSTGTGTAANAPAFSTLASLNVPTQTGAITTGDCVKWASATSVTDAGAACGGGSGTNILNIQAAASAVTSAGSGTPTVLYTYTLPGNTIAAGACVRVTAAWQHTTGTTSTAYYVYFGGVQIPSGQGSATSAFSTGEWLLCNNPGVTNAQTDMEVSSAYGAGGSYGPGFLAGTLDTTVNQTIALEFIVASTTDAVTPKFFRVRLEK
jgi:hypothetical protein